MSDFSFVGTAECDYCGGTLSSSDEDCDHDGQSVDTHVFRRMGGGRASMKGVKSTPQYKWHRLKENVGDDWIAYQYIGTKQHVNSMLNGRMWSDVADLPTIAMSPSAPSELSEEVK